MSHIFRRTDKDSEDVRSVLEFIVEDFMAGLEEVVKHPDKSDLYNFGYLRGAKVLTLAQIPTEFLSKSERGSLRNLYTRLEAAVGVLPEIDEKGNWDIVFLLKKYEKERKDTVSGYRFVPAQLYRNAYFRGLLEFNLAGHESVVNRKYLSQIQRNFEFEPTATLRKAVIDYKPPTQ